MQLYEVQAGLNAKGSRLHPSSPLLRRDKSDFGAARKAEGREKASPHAVGHAKGFQPHAVGEPSRLVQQILRKLSRLPLW
jgi:hypothetical protein